MPSYRVTVSIGSLKPGARPEQVLPASSAAAAELTTVEATDLTVVGGTPRIVIRFTGDDDTAAMPIASAVVERTGLTAIVTGWRVTRRVGGRWEPVAPF
jgi:hypothetical protein